MKVTLTQSIREKKKTADDKELEAAEKKVSEVKATQAAKKAERAKEKDAKPEEAEWVEGIAGDIIEVDNEMGKDLMDRGLAVQAIEKPVEKAK